MPGETCPHRSVTASIHLAAAIAAPDTDAALQQAAQVCDVATLVEYRLDQMGDFNLARLIQNSPLPAIITCRPRQQGGGFVGGERERLGILQAAMRLQAPFVDVELTALAAIGADRARGCRIIGSHHDFEGMLGDWGAVAMQIRSLGADIIKLVGTARTEEDVLIPLAWLRRQAHPGIGLAMGAAGRLSRLLAPRFPPAFLSFGAVQAGTAPGQVAVSTMVERYRFHELAAASPLVVVLGPSTPEATWLRDYEAELRRQLAATARPLVLSLPCQRLGVGVWLSLVLAGVDGLVLLPDIEIAAAVQTYGLSAPGHSYRIEKYAAVMVSYEYPAVSQWHFSP